MSLAHSPKIITDSLALCLDASNIKSYDTGYTVWYDVSGNNNNGTMFGVPVIETDVVKCFNFATVTGASASAASMGFTFASNMVTTTGNFTFSAWIKNPPSSSGQVGLFSNSGSGDGYRFGIGLNGIYYLIGPSYKENTINFLSSISSGTWNNVVLVFSRSTQTMKLYLNGIFQNSDTLAAQTAFANVAPGLVRSACCGLYTGKISQFFVYNKELSANEISQNFSALRGRYLI
jgi:hypothetical protein